MRASPELRNATRIAVTTARDRAGDGLPKRAGARAADDVR